MKTATVIISLVAFIVVAAVYLAWVGQQLAVRAYLPDFLWPW